MHNVPMFVDTLKLFLNEHNPNSRAQKEALAAPLLFSTLDIVEIT
jgi:hypothetical protein